MCVMSATIDYWQQHQWPRYDPIVVGPTDSLDKYRPLTIQGNPVTREEFEELKKEIQALKELIVASKKYDDATGQHNCEMEEKVALVRQVAKAVGVDFSDVFLSP